MGGTLCIADHLAYKNQNHLNLYKKNNFESTFIEIILIILILLGAFLVLNPLLETLAKERKNCFPSRRL